MSASCQGAIAKPSGAGKDDFSGTPAYARLKGAGYYNYASGFGQAYAYAGVGGDDTARLYDSTGDDTFEAGGDWGMLYSGAAGFSNRADDFGAVHLYGTAGGTNTMLLPLDPLAYALVPHGSWA